MSKETYNLQIPIDLDMAEELKLLAKEDDRSLRAYCRQIIKDYLSNKKNPNTIVNKTEPPKDNVAENIIGDYSISFED